MLRMNDEFFETIDSDIRKVSALIRNGKYREAITILNRCMRRLEKFAEKAKGADRLRAIALMKALGQIQTELSEKQIDSIKEESISEEELLDLI